VDTKHRLDVGDLYIDLRTVAGSTDGPSGVLREVSSLSISSSCPCIWVGPWAVAFAAAPDTLDSSEDNPVLDLWEIQVCSPASKSADRQV
jgi:hypothetical protein